MEEENPDEGTPVKLRSEVEQPTPQEIREHIASHIPFRAWCPHCVTGKAKGNPHFRRHYAAIGTPTIAMDYMYMREERKIGGSREIEAEDGEVGEEYQDVGQDVAQGEEAPGVQPVRRGGGCVVHGAGVEVALVHVPVYSVH